ncbi:MAG: transketolase family protein, partial [Actinobacteria bacterium]|nr:transketolase family protein [Actinomycetota bacterium]
TKLNVNIMGNNCGFSVSALGPTHVILEDVAILRSIPNITIISPCDGLEYYQAVFAAAETAGPVYIRIHRQKVKRVNPENYRMTVGKANTIRDGSDVSIITCSSMVPKTLEAAQILAEKGIDAEVINMTTLKPVDREAILESSLKTRRIVTVEEHNIVNGLGTAVADVLIKESPVKMKMIGIKDIFAVVGDYDEVIDYYGLTGPKIAVQVEEFLNHN